MDEEAKKQALRLVPYGLYLVGVRRADVEDPAEDLHAFLGSWVTQCSFDPPQVVVGLRKGSRGLELVRESRVLSLNPLRADQVDLARRFIKNVEVTDGTMEGTPYERGPSTGAPILPDTAASLELEIQEILDAGGDHVLVVAEVVEATFREAPEGMLTARDSGMTYAG